MGYRFKSVTIENETQIYNDCPEIRTTELAPSRLHGDYRILGQKPCLLHSLQQATSMLEPSQHGDATMAFWRKKKDDFETMDEIIQTHPGISPAKIAKVLGLSRSTVTRRLPSVEESGYLYYEDDEGGLWPFKRNK